MLENAHIGLKVDVDTLRGTREGVPRAALLKKLKLDATFYFSVGPDHTGRALRRVFRKGFAQKVARTSVPRSSMGSRLCCTACCCRDPT